MSQEVIHSFDDALMMIGEEYSQVQMNDSLEFSLFNGTHQNTMKVDLRKSLNDFEVPQNHAHLHPIVENIQVSQNYSHSSFNEISPMPLVIDENMCFDQDKLWENLEQNEFSYPVSSEDFTVQRTADISLDDISHVEMSNTATLVPIKKLTEYKLPTEEEQRYDLETSQYYPIVKDVKDVEVLPRHTGSNSQKEFSPVYLEQSQNNTTATLVPSTKSKEYKHWTEQEHRLFLYGLKRYGWGKWKKISDDFVVTRTKTQVASHAQKYLLHVKAPTSGKRRKSIHDTTLRDIAAMVPPNNGQQFWIPTPNFGTQEVQKQQNQNLTQQLQEVPQLQNPFPTLNFATQQLQDVQQLLYNMPYNMPYHMPYQINEVGYLSDRVDPYNFQ